MAFLFSFSSSRLKHGYGGSVWLEHGYVPRSCVSIWDGVGRIFAVYGWHYADR